VNYQIDIQLATKFVTEIPAQSLISQWATHTLMQVTEQAEVTLRFVDEEEGRKLNGVFRNKPDATNVLSFPFFDSQQFGLDLLGDVVICVPVVLREAVELHISAQDHFAHMIIHGILHLLGFDHIEEPDAKKMEALEAKILAEFAIANPYREEERVLYDR
jgi:probable rRNA maturation factor